MAISRILDSELTRDGILDCLGMERCPNCGSDAIEVTQDDKTFKLRLWCYECEEQMDERD